MPKTETPTSACPPTLHPNIFRVVSSQQYETVVEDCTAALELDPRYVKALLRRAQANENLEKYDLALAGDD